MVPDGHNGAVSRPLVHRSLPFSWWILG